MKTAIIENGLFEVNDIGEVYRINDGKKELAVQAKTGRKLNKNALKIADAKALIGSIEAENAAITQHIESLLGTQHDQATA